MAWLSRFELVQHDLISCHRVAPLRVVLPLMGIANAEGVAVHALAPLRHVGSEGSDTSPTYL
jgi:hypothetical protein